MPNRYVLQFFLGLASLFGGPKGFKAEGPILVVRAAFVRPLSVLTPAVDVELTTYGLRIP